ncbi:GIP, partial [Symbiodinium sp. CCMP2456]
EVSLASRKGQAYHKRKARLVACGNHAPGLAEEGELWILTHAVLDPNWWRVVRTSDGVAVGGKEVIAALATAIQGIWKTTPLAIATAEHPLRFLGVEILVQGSGFVLSQQAYAEELLRLNNVKPTALGKVPCPRDLVSFDTLLTDEPPTEETVRTAQRLTGEILWLSQRTRPDLAFTACVLASLSTKAPQRAIRIAEKALAYVQRTKALSLTANADDTGLIAYSDASYAPEGNRSHTGWVVFLHGSPVCWRSARQSFVTLSTAEAELVAGLDAVVALQSAEAMLSEFGVSSLDKTLRVDSQSALAIAIGQGSWRTRHLRVRANYLREQYESGEIIPVYCPGVEQVVGAASQSTDEEEDLSLPVPLDADLMLAVSIICIGICFIAVWEFLKWCLQGVISRREAGTAVSSLSPRKARKLQRLRDQTAQAIQAEISAREEATNSQAAPAAPRRRPSQTTRTREQAGGAPTRYFATPEGTKLHRTKTCSTLAHSHRFVEFQVCQQCHGSTADHTQHSTG